MKRCLVLYSTREAHSRRIAEFVCGVLRRVGWSTDLIDARCVPPGWSIGHYDGAILAASAHLGKHEPEMIRFAEQYASDLEHLNAAFLSISLSQAGAEDRNAPADRRANATREVLRIIENFVSSTGWRPWRAIPVAGALLYTRYNVFLRFVMKRAARKSGGGTDTSRDYVYTDWARLEKFVCAFGGLRLDRSDLYATRLPATRPETSPVRPGRYGFDHDPGQILEPSMQTCRR